MDNLIPIEYRNELKSTCLNILQFGKNMYDRTNMFILLVHWSSFLRYI